MTYFVVFLLFRALTVVLVICWMISGPLGYIPPEEVEVVTKCKAIQLDAY